MNLEKIRRLHSSDPFQPFTLLMADGGALFVERRYYLAFSPTGRQLTYSLPSGGFLDIAVDRIADAVVGMHRDRREAS